MKRQKVLPIDRGWAWLVVFGAFMELFVLLGITKSLGLVFVEILDKYKGSASSASLMYSISTGISLFAAPLITAAAEIFSCRAVCMFGNVLSSIAFIIASQSTSLEQIIFAYGILGGLGHGCSLTPVPVIVGTYFDKKRALANGLAFSGTGLGSMVIPMIMYYILDTFGLHGALIIFGGFAFQTIVFSSLYRPISYYKNLGYTKEIPVKDVNLNDHKDVSVNAHEIEHCIIKETVPDDAIINENPSETARISIPSPRVDADEFITARQFSDDVGEKYHSTEVNLRKFSTLSNDSLYFSAINLAIGSVPDIPVALAVVNPMTETTDNNIHDNNTVAIDKPKVKLTFAQLFKRTCYVKDENGQLSFLFSIELLKNLEYMLIVGGVILALNGFFLTMIVPPHCVDLGFTKGEAAILLSIQGGADMCGRLFTAFTGDRMKPFRSYAFAIYALLASLSSFLILTAKDIYSLTVLLVTCSFSLGAFVALNPVVLTDIVGIQNLGKAWGIQLFFEGFTITVTPFAMGSLKDATGSYEAAFVYLGISFALASILIGCSAWIRTRKSRLN